MATQATDQAPDYQAAVRRLTAENAQLRAEMAGRAAVHRQEAGRLKVLLHEGMSPELAVLRRELARWRDRALAAEGRLANLRRNTK